MLRPPAQLWSDSANPVTQVPPILSLSAEVRGGEGLCQLPASSVPGLCVMERWTPALPSHPPAHLDMCLLRVPLAWQHLPQVRLSAVTMRTVTALSPQLHCELPGAARRIRTLGREQPGSSPKLGSVPRDPAEDTGPMITRPHCRICPVIKGDHFTSGLCPVDASSILTPGMTTRKSPCTRGCRAGLQRPPPRHRQLPLAGLASACGIFLRPLTQVWRGRKAKHWLFVSEEEEEEDNEVDEEGWSGHRWTYSEPLEQGLACLWPLLGTDAILRSEVTPSPTFGEQGWNAEEGGWVLSEFCHWSSLGLPSMPHSLLSGCSAPVLQWLPEAQLNWLPPKHVIDLEQWLGFLGPPPGTPMASHSARAELRAGEWCKGTEARSGRQGLFVLDGGTVASHAARPDASSPTSCAHQHPSSYLKPGPPLTNQTASQVLRDPCWRAGTKRHGVSGVPGTCPLSSGAVRPAFTCAAALAELRVFRIPAPAVASLPCPGSWSHLAPPLTITEALLVGVGAGFFLSPPSPFLFPFSRVGEQRRGAPVCQHLSAGECTPMAGPGPGPGPGAASPAGRTGGASPAAAGPQLKIPSPSSLSPQTSLRKTLSWLGLSSCPIRRLWAGGLLLLSAQAWLCPGSPYSEKNERNPVHSLPRNSSWFCPAQHRGNVCAVFLSGIRALPAAAPPRDITGCFLGRDGLRADAATGEDREAASAVEPFLSSRPLTILLVLGSLIMSRETFPKPHPHLHTPSLLTFPCTSLARILPRVQP
ncbi:hypothetical protein Cadr_000013185 [Camelus dromedarius]|uniref:Uncharacterized protein n=1 Tax=Camelus dromedarius TaxID=9838 RepID=A0A5N4DAP5_CAMDR|nr:hypothetical protein Cadr_000013185 [Camelus dromedarius]